MFKNCTKSTALLQMAVSLDQGFDISQYQ